MDDVAQGSRKEILAYQEPRQQDGIEIPAEALAIRATAIGVLTPQDRHEPTSVPDSELRTEKTSSSSRTDVRDGDGLEAAKLASTGQLLFKAARLWNEAAVARVVSLGAIGLRVAHTAVFPHIDLEGTRTTVIADRMGISKQAVGRLVDDLERMGVVARVPDARDGRAQLVVWTDLGRQGLMHGLDVLRQMEAELGAELGAERVESLRETLVVLIGALMRR